MKKNIVLFGLMGMLISMLGVISCAPDYETEFETKTLVVPDKSQAPVSFPVEGGEAVAEVQTNTALANWSASSNATWLSIDKKEGRVTMTAGSNNTYAPRIARVTIEYGHQAYYINVSQAGNTPFLLVDGQRNGIVKTFDSYGSSFSVLVKSNMVLDHILIPDTADFIHVQNITDVAGSADEKRVTFKVDQSFARKTRYGAITMQSSVNYGHTASFLVVQSEAIYNEIPLRVDMLSSNAHEPKEGPIANLIDGDPGTYFHSLYSSSISEAHYFQITLDNPIKRFLFWYQNRANGNGKPTDVSIMVSADGVSWREMAHITSGLPTGSGSTYESVLYFEETPLKYFRFVVNKTNDGNAPRFFNMAEFKMFTHQE